ncbi:polyisoprenoid-binding protein YceI [Actinomadura rupiterrae]|nr:polyisoprenoid-binding protein YceI [Actinomadura rupiterrae]
MRALDGTAFRVTGDLTIRDVTRPITLDLKLTDVKDGTVAAEARTVIDRNDWGVNQNAMSKLFVSPKVELEIDVTAVRRP